jgi:hypothetical protein
VPLACLALCAVGLPGCVPCVPGPAGSSTACCVLRPRWCAAASPRRTVPHQVWLGTWTNIDVAAKEYLAGEEGEGGPGSEAATNRARVSAAAQRAAVSPVAARCSLVARRWSPHTVYRAADGSPSLRVCAQVSCASHQPRLCCGALQPAAPAARAPACRTR